MKVIIDEAGRVTVPKEIRDRMGLQAGDELEIEELEDRIVLSRPSHEETQPAREWI